MFVSDNSQADICHAFQILTKKGGFPADKIIVHIAVCLLTCKVMMFDDIAHSPSNPTPGVIINKPNGTNVYDGVTKDYTGAQVTAANFLNVISGNKAAMAGVGSGRVVESGPEDNIFIYYSDHGATGLVAMPSGPYLYAKDLLATLNTMHAAKKYNQLTFYLEACESGSMFTSLPNNINVYATTASSADESSYAYYYDAKYQTYLGDEYSVKWMENSDVADFHAETLLQQFQIVKNATQLSHVQEYGQQTMEPEDIEQFQAFQHHAAAEVAAAREGVTIHEACDSRDVKLCLLQHGLLGGEEKYVALVEHELAERSKVDAAIERIAQIVTGSGGGGMTC